TPPTGGDGVSAPASAHVPWGCVDPPAVVAGERVLHEQPGDRDERFVPLLALVVPVHAEPAQLGLRAPLAGTELHAPAGDQVEGGDAFGDPRRVVHGRRELDDPMAETD